MPEEEVLFDEVLYCLNCGKPDLYPIKVDQAKGLEIGVQIPVEATDYLMCRHCGSIWQLKYLLNKLKLEETKNG